MIKKLLIVPTLIALVLSACGGQGAAETVTPAATDTLAATATIATTEAVAPAETVSASPEGTLVTDTPGTPGSATPTAGTPRPTNPPDCTNSASFVADITIPDNTNVGGGTKFTKTWRIANTGTCVWGPDYILVHYSEERMGAPNSVPLPITYPNQNADITVELTAPTATGTHQANFVIENPAGLIMKIGDDSRLWTIINVTAGGTSTVTVSATATGATTASAATATLGTAVTATITPTGSVTGATASSSTSTATTAKCLFTIDRTKLTETIEALNRYRASKGLTAYTVNAQLAQAAQRHANDMACNKIFVHTGSDGSTPQTRVKDTGYIASSVSENIYGSYPPLTGQAVINWWINDKTDPRHGQNLVSTTFTQIGVGYSFFDNYGYYVIVFAKP